MTDSEKLTMVRTLLGITDTQEDERIEVYLDAAKREILSWRYSLVANAPTEVPAEYEMTQIHAVITGYSQSGAEGQLSHNENGISRSFKFSDMIAYIRAHVLPMVGVL